MEHETSFLVVAGEASGEEHAAGLVWALRRHLRASFWGSGGGQMQRAGVELLEDVAHLGAIGPWEALPLLGRYWRLYRRLRQEVERRPPRAAILVDFPDFNLLLAGFLKKRGVPVFYFISPQIWAWRAYRIRRIRRLVDRMLVILPFEEQYYRSRGVAAFYVGNPTATSLLASPPPPWGASSQQRKERKEVALLPGSRESEIRRLLPLFLDSALLVSRRLPVRWWILKAPSLSEELLREVCREWRRKRSAPALDLQIHAGGTRHLLPQVDCAIIKSGTSTLEALLLQVPFVMAYRMSFPSWLFARLLVSAPHYCLANLVAGEEVVPEFIQFQARPRPIAKALLRFLEDEKLAWQVREKWKIASNKLGTGDAYETAAQRILEGLEEVPARVQGETSLDPAAGRDGAASLAGR